MRAAIWTEIVGLRSSRAAIARERRHAGGSEPFLAPPARGPADREPRVLHATPSGTRAGCLGDAPVYPNGSGVGRDRLGVSMGIVPINYSHARFGKETACPNGRDKDYYAG